MEHFFHQILYALLSWLEGDPLGVSQAVDITVVLPFLLDATSFDIYVASNRISRERARRTALARKVISGEKARSQAHNQADLLARFAPKAREEGARKVAVSFSEFLLKLVNFDKVATEKKLQQAGQRDPLAINKYIMKRGLGMIIGPLALWFLAPMVNIDGLFRIVLTIGGMFVGGIVVDAGLDRAVASRKNRLISDLPVLLDLLTIHLEAGSSFDVALARASLALKASFPTAANEVQFLRSELEISVNRERTLREFAERINTTTAKTFVAIVVQSERRGNAMVPALRSLARESRKEVMASIERRAQKIPTIMQLPMFLFILPAIFGAVIGPAVILVMENFVGR